MTRQKLPDKCDLCGKEITSEMQYCSEWYQGRSTFQSPRTRLKELLDCCHPCFIEICKNELKPTWIKENKNPQYVAGSKEASKKYWIPVVEPSKVVFGDATGATI